MRISITQRAALWPLLLAVVAAGPALAGDQPEAGASCAAGEPAATTTAAPAIAAAPATTTPAAPATGGMIVARDPQTGELGLPSVEQRRELLANEKGAVAPANLPLFEVSVPGLGFKIELNGLLMDYAVATRGPDGRPHLSCLQRADDAARMVAAGGQPAASAPVSQPSPQPEEK